MCIAILKPKGIDISKDILKTCSISNKDGMGFAYIDNNKIHINKYMEFDKFYDDFVKVKDKSNMLIHFRIATHGEVNVNNCHPFKLNDRMALIHNGVISGYGDKKDKTDTKDFIDKVIGNISWKMWRNPSYRKLVGKAIGYSKLVILDITGEYFIINEDNGVWDNGIWYSNTSYKPKQISMSFPKNNDDVWDMYGDEDYDTWYTRTKSKKDNNVKKYNNSNYINAPDDTIIYKCKKCGKEFVEDIYIDNPQCDVCRSFDVEEIGIVYRKEKYYYADMVN